MKISLKKTHALSGKIIDVIDGKTLGEVLQGLQQVHNYISMSLDTQEAVDVFRQYIDGAIATVVGLPTIPALASPTTQLSNGSDEDELPPLYQNE
jgi:hypothetical protein